MNNQPDSWSKLTLAQLVEWAVGYIILAIGKGEFRQAVDSMIRQAYSNGYNAKEAELAERRPRNARNRRRSR